MAEVHDLRVQILARFLRDKNVEAVFDKVLDCAAQDGRVAQDLFLDQFDPIKLDCFDCAPEAVKKIKELIKKREKAKEKKPIMRAKVASFAKFNFFEDVDGPFFHYVDKKPVA